MCACLRARVCATPPKHPPLLAHRSTVKVVEGRRRGQAVFLPRVGFGKSLLLRTPAAIGARLPSPARPTTPAHHPHLSSHHPHRLHTSYTHPARARPPDPPQTPPARHLITGLLHAQESNDSTSLTPQTSQRCILHRASAATQAVMSLRCRHIFAACSALMQKVRWVGIIM